MDEIINELNNESNELMMEIESKINIIEELK